MDIHDITHIALLDSSRSNRKSVGRLYDSGEKLSEFKTFARAKNYGLGHGKARGSRNLDLPNLVERQVCLITSGAGNGYRFCKGAVHKPNCPVIKRHHDID